MNSATRDYPPGDLRVSDADRDLAVADLSQAFQTGRITRDEFEQRSGQALRARTGRELTALLADLPPDHAPAALRGAVERARVPTRIAAGVSAATAAGLTAVALTNALTTAGPGPDLAQREFAKQVVARVAGLSIPVPPAQPVPGFDWAGTITPAVFAVLLVALAVYLLRMARASRPGTRAA
jgi:Domain of unknown function (DUF1707)